MTRGTKVEDGQTQVYTSCGLSKVGVLNQRTWSGNNGKQRNNPYDCSLSFVYWPLIDWYANSAPSVKRTGTVLTCFGGGSSPSLPTQAQKDECYTRALKGVLGKWKRHDFSAAVFLGELPETVSMVAEPCMSVLKSYRYARKGKFSKARKVLSEYLSQTGRTFKVDRSASSNWLALRYGWIPAISDAYAAVDAYHALRASVPRKTRLRSKNTLKIPQTQSSLLKFQVFERTFRTQVILETETKQTVLESLGFANPALLAWELLPLSFVVDWVISIGDYLQLCFDLPSGAKVQYITTTKMTAIKAGPCTHPSYVIHKSDAFRERSIDIKRTVSSGPDVPLPRIKNPFNGSLNRVLDMAALARALT